MEKEKSRKRIGSLEEIIIIRMAREIILLGVTTGDQIKLGG